MQHSRLSSEHTTSFVSLYHFHSSLIWNQVTSVFMTFLFRYFFVKRILETKLSLAEDGESVTSQMTKEIILA